MRRLLSATVAALLAAGLLPVPAFAAVPAAASTAATTDEDTPVTVTLSATDADGVASTFAITTPPAHGSLGDVSAVTCDGLVPGTCWADVLYTPDPNANGSDGFGFTATADGAPSDEATVSITITPVNDAPVATDDFGPACVDPFWEGAFPIPEDYAFGPWAPGQPCSLDANDYDVDGDPLTFQLVDRPSHGTATVAPDGSWSYTGDPDFFTAPTVLHSDSFTYRVSDGQAWSAPAIVSLHVEGVNDPPSFTSGGSTVTVAEDSGAYAATWATEISAGPGETDQSVSFIVEATNQGLFATPPAISSAGILTFTPSPEWWGTSTVTVTAKDDGGLQTWGIPGVTARDTSEPVTLTIAVTAVNDAPTPMPSSTAVPEDTAWLLTLQASDVEGDATTAFGMASPPSHGTLGISPIVSCNGQTPNVCTGSAVYTPEANYSGPDAFTFTATDGTTSSDPATFNLAVTAVNDRPVATPQSVSTAEDTARALTLTGTDADGDALTYVVGSAPSHGTLSGSAPNLTYSPAPNYHGPDGFTFTVRDASTTSVPATVAITVVAVNDRPVATPQSLIVAEDTARAVTLTGSDIDGDALTYAVSAQPVHGTLSGVAPNLTYTPVANYAGADSFQFTASDGSLVSTPATVSIAVGAVNDRPVATPQSLIVAEDTPIAITLTATDPDGDLLAYSVVSAPTHGTLAGSAPNLIYTPAANYNGPDSFTFTAADASATSIPQLVSIAISPVNDPPIARTDGVTVNATSTSSIPVIAGNAATGAGRDFSGPLIGSAPSEPDDPVTVTSVTQGAKGVVSIAPGGTAVVYDVRGCSTGGDTFTYTITDSHGLTATASVIVTIARPGAIGASGSRLSSYPMTDAPTAGFISNSTITSTTPVKLAWCGVTKSGSSVRSYRVGQSTNGGSTYSSTLYSATTTTRATRNLGGSSYRWRVRTVDSAGRTGAYRLSLPTRITRYQETNAALVYSATGWRTSATTSALSGAMRYASARDASVSLTVTNVRQFAIVGPRSSTRGSIDVFVDDVLVATVSERASTKAYRRVLYVRSVAAGASHAIRLQPHGNGRVDLDAILTLR